MPADRRVRWSSAEPPALPGKVQVRLDGADRFRRPETANVHGGEQTHEATTTGTPVPAYAGDRRQGISRLLRVGDNPRIDLIGHLRLLPADSRDAEHTEAAEKPGVRDLHTEFKDDLNRVLLVANRFQTGFDQPLLCSMYVNKKLSGVMGVQSLSRLNRIHVTKHSTINTSQMIQAADFVNTAENIAEARKPHPRSISGVLTGEPAECSDEKRGPR
ncbi:UvrB domain 3-containing protein [Streptomyces althioticus]|uniref:type I restriction enzyme subunit R domain-containing protein n=1 Tax=Streptomyces althioticus TaxID=83380 RepID=UPI003797FD1D